MNFAADLKFKTYQFSTLQIMSSADLVLTDPVFQKKDSYNFIDNIALKFIRDERDLPFIYLMLKIVFLIIPVAIYLFLPGRFTWWIAIPYTTVVCLFFNAPFTLMLHNTSHRKFFKKEYEKMNNIIPWLLGPFFGQSPETYFAHHIGMHHLENNLPPDLSATILYQRDSVRGFLHYFGDFFFVGLVRLVNYFRIRKRWWFVKWLLTGEVTFFLMIVLLLFVSVPATVMVFIIPFIFIRFGMMAGNWGQHAFIDAEDAANNYKNSITCVNVRYNHLCFNDGYHIGHHIRPNRHWTEMSTDFHDNMEEYGKNEAIVFKGVDFFIVWFLLMTKNYKKLAKQFIDVGNRFNGDQEAIIAFLKKRTARVPVEQAMKYCVSPQC